MDILFLIILTFAAGVIGGLVLAEGFELEAREQREREQAARRKARHEQKMRNIYVDKFGR